MSKIEENIKKLQELCATVDEGAPNKEQARLLIRLNDEIVKEYADRMTAAVTPFDTLTAPFVKAAFAILFHSIILDNEQEEFCKNIISTSGIRSQMVTVDGGAIKRMMEGQEHGQD